MENIENFESNAYILNYEEIVKAKDIMAVARLLAADLMRTGYVNVGDYIRELSDSDLDALVKQMDLPPDSREYDNLLLMSEMLATGEGCDSSKTADEFGERMNQLVSFLVCESLSRKGLVKVFHENMSFHTDMSNKIVVEKI